MANELEEIRQATDSLDTEEFLKYFLDKYGSQIALASSLSAEDQVITEIMCRISQEPRIFTLDTGRLPNETYDVLAATTKKYNIKIKVLFPDRKLVEDMVTEHGINAFYDSIESRKLCCKVRKVIPLQRELTDLDAWITGLRRQQAQTRTEMHRVEWDEANNIPKINPLADWTTQQVWDYIRNNKIPYNALHDANYPSIGCAPCTRAVTEGQDIRQGRWWWELPEQKECGLHLSDGKLVRNKKD